MRKLIRTLGVSLLAAAALAAAAPKKPKLVLAIVFDQFRYDYLTRFQGDFTAGFHTLLTEGAVFTNAHYVHFPTVTAVGHSTFLSGATPSISGIVGNDWYDRDQHKHVTSVSDSHTQLLGGTGAGSSPHRMLVDTVGDELKLEDNGRSRVIGVSLKDRAAILPAGHLADAAYWFDPATGNFVSSTYYFNSLPEWVDNYNRARPADHYENAAWLDHKMPGAGRPLYSAVETSPFGNDLVERFAERALEAEQLGRHDATDLLAVSFSSTDYVGHAYGPYSREEREVVLRADKQLQSLLQAVDRQVGLANVLVVLTSDHGVAPAPGRDTPRGMPGGRIPPAAIAQAVESALVAKYGEGKWVCGSWDLSLYLDHDLIARKGLDAAAVRNTAAQAVFAVPHISRVYTLDQLASAKVPSDDIARRFENGFNARRSADVEFLPEPYWIVGNVVATHGTTFDYDTHVPVVFMGAGIRPGRYDEPIIVNDIAPTLATILEIETPSGSIGRALNEMWIP